MLTITHNLTQYKVNYDTAVEESPEFEKFTHSEVQIDDVHSEEIFSMFVDYLNHKPITLTRSAAYDLEILAVEYGCENLHNMIFDFAFQSNDTKLIRNLITHIFEFGYHAHVLQKDACKLAIQYDQQLTKLKELRAEQNDDSEQITTLLTRIPRDNSARIVKVGFFGAPSTGKTSLWRLLDPSLIATPLEPSITDEFPIFTKIQGEPICFRVEDTGGSKTFRGVHLSSLKELDAAIFVYRNDQNESLDYIKELIEESDNLPKHCLLFTSTQNPDDKNDEKGQSYANEKSMQYYIGKPDKASMRFIEEFLISSI